MTHSSISNKIYVVDVIMMTKYDLSLVTISLSYLNAALVLVQNMVTFSRK